MSDLYIEEHPESGWPWWLCHRAGRWPIARFLTAEGCEVWRGYLERAA